jgi:hypothetical protein
MESPTLVRGCVELRPSNNVPTLRVIGTRRSAELVPSLELAHHHWMSRASAALPPDRFWRASLLGVRGRPWMGLILLLHSAAPRRRHAAVQHTGTTDHGHLI